MPEPTRLTLRVAAMGIAAIAACALLPGCSGSGAYAYLGDTFTLPFGSNPNVAPPPAAGPVAADETYARVRGRNVERPAPILYETGDVWPAPPKPPATLKDLQMQQTRELSSSGSGTPNYTPLQPLPQLPGYEVPQQQAHAAAPQGSFPGGIVSLPSGQRGVATGTGRALQPAGPASSGSIVVPNGNGTSTVIGPNGSVSTIQTPGK